MIDFYKNFVAKYNDKMLHFLVSFFLAMVLSVLLPIETSAVIVILIGFVKELLDLRFGGHCSPKDALADTLGVLIAVIVAMI